MAKEPTVIDLIKQGHINDHEVTAAVEVYMETTKTARFVFSGGYGIDLSAAVRAHASIRKILNDCEASEGLKRAAVRKAILSARPARERGFRPDDTIG